MEFIPPVGVLVSGAVCVVIALFQGWVTALLVLIYFAVVHVIEGEVVGLRIMGKAEGGGHSPGHGARRGRAAQLGRGRVQALA